jgi:hypothetical protein
MAAALTYQHVFMITEENHSEAEIVGNPVAPYINETLIAHGALATNYFAINHPDLPDDLALTSGSEWGDVEDTTPQAQTYPGPVIADQFQWASIPWHAYVQGMPKACDLTDQYSPRGYDVNHNPFMYFSEVRSNPAECRNDVPFSRMATNLQSASTTPAFAYIVPDLANDMDSEGAIQEGDTWLSHEVPVIMGSPACQISNCLLIVTWDQDDGSENNHVPTIFYGNGVPQGYKSPAHYNQYSLLRTIEANFVLAPMTANDAGATPMTDMLGTASGQPTSNPMPTTAPAATSTTASAATSTTASAAASTTASAAASTTASAATPTPAPTAAPTPAPPTWAPPTPAPATPAPPTPAPPTPTPAATPTPTPSGTETNVCLLIVCLSLGL